MSYVLPVIVKILPLQVHQRNTRNAWRWLAFMAILLLLTGGTSYLMGAALIGNLATLVTRFLFILMIGLGLIAVGGMLGWRRMPWVWCLSLLGFAIGVMLGMGRLPSLSSEYWVMPGVLLPVAGVGLILTICWGILKRPTSEY